METKPCCISEIPRPVVVEEADSVSTANDTEERGMNGIVEPRVCDFGDPQHHEAPRSNGSRSVMKPAAIMAHQNARHNIYRRVSHGALQATKRTTYLSSNAVGCLLRTN